MIDKLRFWASFTLFAVIGAIALLNRPIEHERANSREVVIDMPCVPPGFVPLDGSPETLPVCPLGNDVN